ncbi:calcyclin binding protein [Cyclospora cayetanensis]|uniref:Calcyclin binding protein n=1 Tax=Cyclospora cayetanensis TaxID=88456 RepID=A0A1D3CR95_9EIME|nr:calcyclin binding protein [Cyclospora cayetanensis]
MDSKEEMRLDLEELASFLKTSKRASVSRLLSEQCQRLRDQIQEIERIQESAAQAPLSVEVFNTIDRFAWDQTPQFVKVYVELEGLASVRPEEASAHFEEHSAEFVLRPGEHWESIAKIAHQNVIPKPDLSSDPSQSIMSMMKSLYDQGDSEMKRTIAKAWTESQERKVKGSFADDGIF